MLVDWRADWKEEQGLGKWCSANGEVVRGRDASLDLMDVCSRFRRQFKIFLILMYACLIMDTMFLVRWYNRRGL